MNRDYHAKVLRVIISMDSGTPVLRSLYRIPPSTCTVEPLFYGHSTEYIHQHIHWNPCFMVTLQSTSINIYIGTPVLRSLYRVHPSTCTVEPLFCGHSTGYIYQHVQWNPCFTVTLQDTSIDMYSGIPVLRSLHRVHLQGSQRSGKSGNSGKILKTFSSQGNQGKTGGFQPKSGKKNSNQGTFFANHFETF